MRKLIAGYIGLYIFFAIPASAADITQEYRYQVLVNEKVNGTEYNDAIYYHPDDWENLKQSEVDKEISRRVDNFKDALENPPTPVEPTKQELMDAKAQLVAQVAQLDVEIAKK